MEVITERKSKRTGKKVYRVVLVGEHKYHWFGSREEAEQYVVEVLNEKAMAVVHSTDSQTVAPAELPEAQGAPSLP